MIKEAEILDPTGVMYIQENPYAGLSAALAGSLNVHNPVFSHTSTGEDTRIAFEEQPEISPSLLPYHFLSMTTGFELSDVDIVIVVETISERITTDCHITFEYKGWTRAKSDARPRDQRLFSDPNSASVQAERLREISGLTIERLAEIFDVSRTTYHKWISGSPLHDTHREHLLEVLPLMEEATQRLGSPGATSTWLLTPVSPGGKKPIDYLAAREYSIFRGFLLSVRTGQEMFRPLAPSNRIYKERSPAEVKEALERLRPRAWRDDDIEKAALLLLTPKSSFKENDKVTPRKFSEWLARRYNRPALPDAIVNAIQKPIVKAIDKLPMGHNLHRVLDGIDELLFFLRNDTIPFQVDMIFLRDERNDAPYVSDEDAARLGGWIANILQKGNEATLMHWKILSRKEISVYDYSNAYELPLDYYTSWNDSTEG